ARWGHQHGEPAGEPSIQRPKGIDIDTPDAHEMGEGRNGAECREVGRSGQHLQAVFRYLLLIQLQVDQRREGGREESREVSAWVKSWSLTRRRTRPASRPDSANCWTTGTRLPPV